VQTDIYRPSLFLPAHYHRRFHHHRFLTLRVRVLARLFSVRPRRSAARVGIGSGSVGGLDIAAAAAAAAGPVVHLPLQ
jgi:hypothetical protein